MARFPIEQWTVFQLRLTAFVSTRVAETAEGLWESATEASPDVFSASPKKGTSEAEGTLGPGKLLLRIQPDRLDWLMTPEDIDPESPPVDPVRSFGQWEEGLATFNPVATAWLGRTANPQIERLAFGAILLHPENSREDGYSRLADYIPVAPSPETSDFLYQINHPIASETGIENLRINRLTRWSTAVFRSIGFSVHFGHATIAPVAESAVYALRLELDINTSPDLLGGIPANRLIDVYQELVTRAREIAVEGLRP